MRVSKHFGQIRMTAICHIRVNDSKRSQRACALTTRNTMNVLGIQLNAPSLMGLIRMLGFTLAAIALVEIADSLNSGVWASEGSLSFIVGGFSGFLLNEAGADFSKHGWRAFALLIACAIFVFAAFSLAL
jgi:hypothetical protein